MGFLKIFLTAFGIVAAAELGDKTQLIVMSMSVKFKARDVFIGVSAAILILNGLAVFLGRAVTAIIPIDIISVIAGAAFIFFALWTLYDKEQKEKDSRIKFALPPIFTVGFTFFIAELGDKTQLTAIILAAKAPDMLLAVFSGAVTGMILIDCFGLFLGKFVLKKLPKNYIKWVSAIIFSAFGVLTVKAAARNLFGIQWSVIAAILISILIIAAALFISRRKKLLS